MVTVTIREDDLRGAEVAALLEEHLADMRATSPPESTHALDLDGLRRPEIAFWTVWTDDGQLAGCGALKDLGNNSGEIKSMRTAAAFRGCGLAFESCLWWNEVASLRHERYDCRLMRSMDSKRCRT